MPGSKPIHFNCSAYLVPWHLETHSLKFFIKILNGNSSLDPHQMPREHAPIALQVAIWLRAISHAAAHPVIIHILHTNPLMSGLRGATLHVGFPRRTPKTDHLTKNSSKEKSFQELCAWHASAALLIKYGLHIYCIICFSEHQGIFCFVPWQMCECLRESWKFNKDKVKNANSQGWHEGRMNMILYQSQGERGE